MKKFKKLLDYYKTKRFLAHFLFPALAIMPFILGIWWLISFSSDKWVGWVLIGLAVFVILMYILFLISYNHEIDKLEKEEAAEEEKLRKLEQAEAEKDERIKELEEELNKMKNDDHSDA